MSVSGSPWWLRVADAAAYGGGSHKRDYGTQGPVNPVTDLTAAQLRRLTADLAGVSRMAPFCRLRIQLNDGTPAAPTIVASVVPNASRSQSYEGDAAPDGFPTATRLGNGQIRITLPAEFTDDANETAAATILFPEAEVVGAAHRATIATFTATTVDIHVTEATTTTAVLDQIITVSLS